MSARDAAVERLAATLGLSQADAAELVDRLTHAAAAEATARVAEGVIAPIQDALESARRTLLNGHDGGES